MLEIRKEQFEVFENKFVSEFYQDLKEYLSQEFPDISGEQQVDLLRSCHVNCNLLNIQNADGIYAYFTLSFMTGLPISVNDDYMDAHKRYLLKGYLPDQVPVDMLEAMSNG